MRRALQYSAAVSICGLWVPRGAGLELNDGAFEEFLLGAGDEPAAGEVSECGLSRQYGLGSVVLPPGPRARAGVDHGQQLRRVVTPGFPPGLVGVECRDLVVRSEKQFEVLFQIQL